MTASLATVAGFNGADGLAPDGRLIPDGGLFGATCSANEDVVVEIAKTAAAPARRPFSTASMASTAAVA